MKRAAVVSFDDFGAQMAVKVASALARDWQTEFRLIRDGLRPAVELLFRRMDALVFVGACGTAIRAIAPCLREEAQNPAVVALDAREQHIVSLLSGRVGDANSLAVQIAQGIGGRPIITTACGQGERFRAEDWAARCGLWVADLNAARRFSEALQGGDLPLYTPFPIEGALPAGLYPGEGGMFGMAVDVRERYPFDDTLLLVPRILHVGIGCKPDAPAAQLRRAIDMVFVESGLCGAALGCVASIETQAGEDGVSAYCASAGLPLRRYAPEELNALSGQFTASGFSRRTVGVDCVCERSAMRSAGKNARLLVSKRRLNGVTIAVAREDWSVRF